VYEVKRLVYQVGEPLSREHVNVFHVKVEDAYSPYPVYFYFTSHLIGH
jgi:hypothetical protein